MAKNGGQKSSKMEVVIAEVAAASRGHGSHNGTRPNCQNGDLNQKLNFEDFLS